MTNESPSNQQLSANKQALLKIRELKQKLAEAEAESGSNEPIAIVSMACRFPRHSRTPETFWQSLINQTDEVGDIPEDRWDHDAFHDDDPEVPGKMYARRGVFLDDLDQMDPEFFGISPREATWVDPQQRLLMEVGWEAIERASWIPEAIGEDTGVFVGWMHNDYQNEASDSFLNLNPYIATGAAGSFLCGRLAYYLGLQGPSVAVDTACSSSLVALHLAIQSLQRRDCNRALVGGVNAIVSPTTNILTCKLKALSPTGQSRAFDAAADGYLRGEGCGVVTLRRLSDARKAKDPILGIIRGSAVGHNGFSSGLTAPNPKAQEKVIRQALERAGVAPEEIGYLEAHGTGTELGDPIEIQAAAAALTHGRSDESPLLVGSVKTNIGHLEAASGMAGLIKVLLSMQKDQIPGQLNFETPNPHIPWEKIPVKVLTEATAWPNPERKIAGVSAFGMSGTNAHVVIEAPDSPNAEPTVSESSVESQPARMLVLSGRSEEAVQTLAENYAESLSREPETELADVAFTTGLGRSHFEHRAAIVAQDTASAIQQLKNVARGSLSDSAFMANGRRAPKVAWQFTGQGSQFVGMAKRLYECQPVFREVIDRCESLVQSWRNESLTHVMFRDEDKIHDTRWTQPAIFALQMGLVAMLKSWGLEPSVVYGHSVGQFAAACVAGIVRFEDGLRLICERGRLIGDLPAGGKMLAIFAPEALVAKQVESVDGVSLAAINGTHVVVSGVEKAVLAIQAAFDAKSVRTKLLTTSHAFHSALMEPVLEPFSRVADSIDFSPPKLPLICNVSGKPLSVDTQLNGDYWARHIREAVRFSDCVDSAVDLNCDVNLELGPQSVLTRMAAANWKRESQRLFSCLQKEVDDEQAMMQAVAQLYVHGQTPDFDSLYANESREKVLLPTYPFQRRRFWGPDKPRAFHAEYHTAHPLLGSQVSLAGIENESRFESFIEPDSPPWLPDHEVMGATMLPGAAYVEMALAAAGNDQVTDVSFEQPLRPSSRTSLQTVVRKTEEGRSIETFSSPADSKNWTRNFVAKLVPNSGDRPAPLDIAALEAACPDSAEPEDFYRKMQELGLNYGPKFQTISSIRYSETQVHTKLKTNGDVRGFIIPPTILDGALHSLAVGLLREDDGYLFLPIGMGRVACHQSIENEVWCHATWKINEGKLRTADLVLLSDSGQVVAEIEDLRVQQVSIASLRQMSGAGAERLVYSLDWERYRLPAPSTGSKKWLVVAANGEPHFSREVGGSLSEKGHAVVHLQLSCGSEFSKTEDNRFLMCGALRENWKRLLESLGSDSQPYAPEGIAWIFDQGTEDCSTQLHCEGLLNLASVLLECGQRSIDCGLQLITSDAISVSENKEQRELLAPAQSQYWGLGRVIGAEQPEFRCRLIDVSSAEQSQEEACQTAVEILQTETQDNQLVIRNGQIFVPRMKRMSGKRDNSKLPFEASLEKSYLITGGLGKLGRQAAKWLAEKHAGQVILVSRRKPDKETQTFLDSISRASDGACEVVVHAADFGSRESVEALFAKFGKEWNPLGGVLHAAGVVDDGLIGDQNWERFEKVLAPKVTGASLLHELTQDLDLDFFILYSSAASVLGSPGQSNYATANAYLDGLAWRRKLLGLPATSINWGPWTEGMADDERILKRLALQGITPLAIDEAHSAMEKILAAELTQATVMDVDWRRMRMAGESPAMLQGLAPSRQKSQMGDSELVAQIKQLRGNAQRELVVKTMQQLLQGILSTPDLPETERPLIELGLDSLMAVEFGTELQQMLGDQFAVGPTMLFDHPTIDAISDFILELVAADSKDSVDVRVGEADEPSGAPAFEKAVRDDVAIIGMSCRFPGAQNVEEFWQNLLDGVDSVCEIPSDRWDIDRYFSEDREPGKMYTRQGGFLDDIAEFDAEFFNISPQEACWIDPQHRMLLENSYRAMEDAGISPHPLSDANVGVFMGIMGQDYAFIPTMEDMDVIKAFQGAGLSHSAGVGRISYVFGFEGPSIAVDTASSSSLVALMQAVRSLQDGNCNMALAGGVNAILAPVNSLLMSKAGLLSPDGRCKSFSAAADGFGRGEGCGVVVLKRLSDAQRDGDRIMAVVRGGAVVHNGFSSGITAPSGKAQSRVIDEALKDAKLAPSQVQYLEAHGTGTEYGDPMELGAAAAIYGKGRKQDRPLLVGSVKANISHLEAAGGVSGLIKTVLSIHRGVIPPQAQFDEPSPHVPWKRMPLKMVTETTPWPECESRLAGVTALGLVGTNAHVVLSSNPEQNSPPQPEEVEQASPRQPQLLVLSARNRTALSRLVASYLTYLDGQTDEALVSICNTARIGRRHFEHRLSITGQTVDEMKANLSAALEQQLAEGHLTSSNGKAHLNGAESNGAVHSPESKRGSKLSWVFPDSQESVRVATTLFANEPEFRKTMLELESRLAHHFSEQTVESSGAYSLLPWLQGESSEQVPPDVKQYALQAGLAKLWMAWGIEPDVVLGLGVGQYTASCVAGGICFLDALVLVVERCRVLGHHEEAAKDKALDNFECFADTLNFYPPNLPMICGQSGEIIPVHRSLGGSFWREHLSAKVGFEKSLKTLSETESDLALVIGEHENMNEFAGELAQRVKYEVLLSVKNDSGHDASRQLLETLGRLYVVGINPDFRALLDQSNCQRVSLPSYPFQRKRYWITEVEQHLGSKELVNH